MSASPDTHNETYFDVVFHGETLDGYEVETVKASFAKLFKLPAEKVEQIFASSRVVLKPNVSNGSAKKMQQALMSIGAQVALEAKPSEVADAVETPEETSSIVSDTADNSATNTAEASISNDDSTASDDSSNSIYQTPEADLVESTDTSDFGSLKKAEAGDFDASIGTVLSQAWAKVAGNKGRIWGSLALYIVSAVILSVILDFVLGSPEEAIASGEYTGLILSQLIQALVMMPIGMGVAIFAVKVAVGSNASVTSIFSHYQKFLPLLLTYLLMLVLIFAGFLLLVIPGIYLSVAYSLALMLVIDKNLGPWAALEASRKAITKCWFSVFGLWIAVSFIVMIAIIPLGIGLIWAMPLAMLALGVLYRNIFGLNLDSDDD